MVDVGKYTIHGLFGIGKSPVKHHFRYIGSMGRTVYLPIHEWLIFYGFHVGINIP